MANQRIKYLPNQHSILYGETRGFCPLCAQPMMFKKATSKLHTIGYEIAHIYPLNPTSAQKAALKNRDEPSDPNSLDNVILLCPTCHTKYDKDFDVGEYDRLLSIKKGYISDTNAKNLISRYDLIDEVKQILDVIASDESWDQGLSPGEFEVGSLGEKLKTGISPLLKREIRANAVDFFVSIRSQIRLIEQRDQLTVRMLQSQVRAYFIAMSRQNPGNKDAIFNHIADWISAKSGASTIAAKVLASFFVQNCEIFDVDSN